MRKQVRIEAVKKTYTNPIILNVTKNVFKGLGAKPDFIFTLTDMSIKNDKFESREEVQISVTDRSRDIGSVIRAGDLYSDYPVFIMDGLGFKVVPFYAPLDFEIKYTVLSTSRTSINTIVDNLVRIKRSGMVHLMSGNGSFAMPQEVIDRIRDINRCRTESGLPPITDEEMVKAMSTQRVSLTTNLSEQEDMMIVNETQSGITLTLTPSIDNKAEFITKDSIYKYEFTVTLNFQAPIGMNIYYEPIAYSRFIDNRFLPRSVIDNRLEDYVYYRDVVIKMFEMSGYMNWNIVDGVIQDGVFQGVYIGVSYTGLLKDSEDAITFINSLYINDGYCVIDDIEYDLGFVYNGRVSDLPNGVKIDSLGWTVKDGLITSGPFAGKQLENGFTGVLDGWLFNNTVFGGMLDGFVIDNNIGGIAISGPEGKPYVVGGLLSNKIIASIEVSLPFTIPGTISETGLVTGGFLDGKFLDGNKLGLYPNADMEILSKRNIIDKDTYGDVEYNFNCIHIPAYDTFRVKNYRGSVLFMSLLIQREKDNPTFLFSLNDMSPYTLDSGIMEMIKLHGNSENLTSINQFPIFFEVHSNKDGILSPAKLLFDNDTMSFYLVEGLDVRTVYRVFIHVLKDYTTIWDGNVRKIMDEFTSKYNIVYISDDGILSPYRNFVGKNKDKLHEFRIEVISISSVMLENKSVIKEMLWR